MAINQQATTTITLNNEQAKRELDELQNKIKNLIALKKKAEAEGDITAYKKVSTELNKSQKEANAYQRQLESVKSVLSDMSGATLKQLQNALRSVNAQLMNTRRGTAEFKSMQQAQKQLQSEIDKTTGRMRLQQTPMQRITTLAKGMLPAFGFAAIIGGAIKAGRALFDMYVNISKARQQAERLTGLSGKNLADFTADVQASAKTFNQDFNQLLVGVNSFAKTMGISVDEALKKVNDGFLTGADASGELLNIIKEYGPQFKAAGLSADESIALISQQVKSGIYSDKGIDSIKEATISIREMTPATRAAIDGIGLSSATIQKQLRDGTITVFDAIQQISRKMGELPPQSTEVGTAIADIFRGAGEDAGLDYITMLGTAEMSLEKLKTSAGENAVVQGKLLEANEKLNKAWSELMGTGTGTLSAIKAFAIDLTATGISKVASGIADLRDWFVELYNESLPVRAGFQYMIASWITGFNIVKTAFQNLWEQLKLGGKLIKAILTFDLSGIKEAFLEYGNNMRSAIVTNAQNVASSWKNAWENTINGKLKPVKQRIETEIVTPAGNIISARTTRQSSDTKTETPSATRSLVDSPQEMESISDPRIVTEETFTQTVLEQSKLRQHALDTEQKAAEQRAIVDEQLQQQKRDAYLSTLDTIINVFGQESKIGRAALLAKQAYAIAETIINIAKGSGETASAVPFPANIPLIIGFVAQVAGLISTIKGAVASTTAKGYATGGYTGPGAVNKPSGIVHAGEWVAPHWMLKNPETRPVISILENLRKNRSQINIAAISDMSATGFRRGGFVSAQTKTTETKVVINSDTEVAAMLHQVKNALEQNSQATREFMRWKPKIAAETIEKELNTLQYIRKHSGL